MSPDLPSDSPQRPLPTDRLGFYIASGDQDILSQVNRLMQRSGYVGLMDTAGRFQYLVDGRRGSPLAARRILEAADKILARHEETDRTTLACLGRAVDQVLAAHAIRPELKGARFLRHMLLDAGVDETLLRPISKTLYPAVAGHFRVSVSQIERDIRYCLHQTDFRHQGLASVATICRLHDEVVRLVSDLRVNEMPPGSPGGQRGAD